MKKLQKMLEERFTDIHGSRHQLLIGVAIILFGITLSEITLAYKMDYSPAAVIFYVLLGIAVAVVGFVCFVIPGLSRKRHEMDYTENFSPDTRKTCKDETDLDKSLTRFRRDYADFFTTEEMDNPPVQNDTTQFLNNMVDLQKKRLDRHHVKLEMISERRNYSGSPVKSTGFFDGKYEINDVCEEIEAKRRFSKDGETLLVKSDTQIAHYSIINAKRIGEEHVICPGCGSETTRENLIDGCDYCGTKFHVEDLGEKISSFALRDNYDTAYARFKEYRLERAYRFGIVAFIIIYLFLMFCVSLLMFDETASGADASDAFNPVLFALSCYVITAIFSGFLMIPVMIVYLLVVFPLVEKVGSVKYHHHKKLAAIKKAQKKDREVETEIRNDDPLFSVTDFYSNIQNKLATVLYADSEKQINIFAETSLTDEMEAWKDVLDFDVDDISLDAYEVRDGEQNADVSVEMSVIELKGKKAFTAKRKVCMHMIKSASCKTQAICEPFVTRCSECGSSLSLTEGLICEFCGFKPDLKQYDWVIRKMEEEIPELADK